MMTSAPCVALYQGLKRIKCRGQDRWQKEKRQRKRRRCRRQKKNRRCRNRRCKNRRHRLQGRSRIIDRIFFKLSNDSMIRHPPWAVALLPPIRSPPCPMSRFQHVFEYISNDIFCQFLQLEILLLPLKMWNTRKSYPVGLCVYCSKKTCFKCPKPYIVKNKCEICPGCAPSKKMKCTKCRSTRSPFMSAYYCQECSIKYDDLCAMCSYVLGLKEERTQEIKQVIKKEEMDLAKKEQVQVPKAEQKVQKQKVQSVGKKEQS